MRCTRWNPETWSGRYRCALHYCERHELNADNLEYFQKLAETEACTEEYRNSLRKQILDFYAAHVDGEDMDRYLYKLDYRRYMEADRKVLLEVLISRRMFRQAEEPCRGIWL